MKIELTQEQQQTLDTLKGEIPWVIDPRTNTAYVLVPEGDYVTIRELLEDERKQRAIRATGLHNAEERMQLAQEILDGLAAEAKQLELTVAQKHELARRLADHAANPSDVIPWELVKAEALARTKR
jgi:putative addiction module component (TIGR02574 family)